MVEAIPPHPMSDDRDALFDVRGRSAGAHLDDRLARVAAQRARLDVFRMYLDVALICGFGTLKAERSELHGPAGCRRPRADLSVPRRHLRQRAHAARLSALRASDAAFVDADFALGRYALDDAVNPDQEEALRRLRSASAAFPRSPAIAVTIGNVYRRWEEWADALDAYDAALAGVAATIPRR